MTTDRRSLLKMMAASPLAFSALPGSAIAATLARPRKVIVIGAGIIGAGIAYELAKRGAQVTILDRFGPATGITKDSYAYLNATAQEKTSSRPYFSLNWLGIAGWRVWQQELGGSLPLHPDGAVIWRDTPAATADAIRRLKIAQQWGYSGQLLDGADLKRLLPTVDTSSGKQGVFFPEEGSVDPAEAVGVLLEQAQRLGAKLVFPAEVQKFLVAGARVTGVRTQNEELTADTVVIAAGPGSEALAASAGIRVPLSSIPIGRLQTEPLPKLLDRAVSAPGSSFRQKADGRIVISTGGDGGIKRSPEETAIHAREIIGKAAAYLPALRDASVHDVVVGQRMVPVDSFPIVGFAPQVAQLYVAVTHSGMTLAPAVGRLAATEILDGVSVDILAPYRPDRFA